jgi:hypothetical protein
MDEVHVAKCTVTFNYISYISVLYLAVSLMFPKVTFLYISMY